jgi:hypothetical protein
MTLDVNGNFGVGNTSPEAKFTISQIGNGWNDGLRINRDATNYLTLTEDVADIRLKNWGTGGLLFFTSTSQPLTILNGGNVGIGTNAPSGLLEIKGAYIGNSQLIINATGTSGELRFSEDGVPKGFVWYGKTGNYMAFGRGSTTNSLFVDGAGNFGIGTTTPGSFKLAVEGKIYGKEVQVALTNPGPDYVFANNYQLLTLNEVKTYIDQHKHLPEVPSAKEMEKDGIQLGEMNMLLLKKIEELTLYMIEQNKKLTSQNDLILKQHDRITKLENSKQN